MDSLLLVVTLGGRRLGNPSGAGKNAMNGAIDDLDNFQGEFRGTVFTETPACLVGFEPGWVSVDFLGSYQTLYLAQMSLHRND